MYDIEVLDFFASQMIPKKDFWQIALDGSGPITVDDKHYAFAGVMGPSIAWSGFAEKWEGILNKYELPYFRMTEAMGFRGVFHPKVQEWGDDRFKRRDELLWELVGLINQIGLHTIGFACQTGGLSEKQSQLRKREVFQNLLLQILGDHRERHFLLACDTEHDAADYYRSWLVNLQQRDEASRRIFGLAFMDDKIFAAIQPADFVAYLCREDAERDCFRPHEPMNPLTLKLRGAVTISGRMLDGKSI